MSGGVSFDRAAEEYDRTRALPPEAMSRIVEQLAAELEDRQPCLEIGVGTGRIALPLAGRGIRMAGIDLSEAMLRRLRENAADVVPFPAALADASLLPFADGCFGSALGCHVLHLVHDRAAVLRELVRVVRPGGVLLFDFGGWGSDWWRQVQDRFAAEAGAEREHTGDLLVAEVDEAMASHGATLRLLPPVQQEETVVPETRIRQLEDGVYSFTWPIDPEVRRRAGAAVRPWLAERIGRLDEPHVHRRQIVWRGYDLPASPGPSEPAR